MGVRSIVMGRRRVGRDRRREGKDRRRERVGISRASGQCDDTNQATDTYISHALWDLFPGPLWSRVFATFLKLLSHTGMTYH